MWGGDVRWGKGEWRLQRKVNMVNVIYILIWNRKMKTFAMVLSWGGGRGEGEMTGSNLINVKCKHIQKCQYNDTHTSQL
jgi:hypothetical protein